MFVVVLNVCEKVFLKGEVADYGLVEVFKALNY
jgi:hypothetical protein